MPYVDWNEVPDQEGFEPIPAGDYDARLSNWTPFVSKKGNSCYNVEYTLQESAGEYRNRKVWDILTVDPENAPKALFRFKRDMVRLGADTALFASNTDTDDIIASVMGSECRLTITQEPYESNGETKISNRIKEVKAPAFVI